MKKLLFVLFLLSLTQIFCQWQTSGPGITSHITDFTSNGRYIFAATDTQAIYRSSIGNDIKWESMVKFPNNVKCLLMSSTGVLFAGTSSDCLYESENDGISWDTTSLMNYSVTCLAESNGQLLAGTTAGLARSTDNFKTFDFVLKDVSCTTVYFDGTNIIVGDHCGDIFISSDNGINWKSSIPTNLPIMGIVKGNDIYVGTLGGGVFISKDSGQSWNPLNDGISNLRIFSLSIINNILFCGTDGWQGGLFYLANSSKHWIKIPTAEVGDFAITTISQIDNRLFVGTWNNGAWTIPVNNLNLPLLTYLKNTTVKPTFSLEQNYPNPFNPSTVISYRLPAFSKVLLKIFDSLGKEVATLVDKEQSAGNYEVKFDGTNYSSGIYLCRIQAGNLTQSKKMILMK